MVDTSKIVFKATDGKNWDYWFIDKGILKLKLASLGPAVVGGLLGGAIGGVIIKSVWTHRARSKNKTLTIDELLANKGNELLAWSAISSITMVEKENKLVISMTNGRVYDTGLEGDFKEAKKFLVSKLNSKVVAKDSYEEWKAKYSGQVDSENWINYQEYLRSGVANK